VNRHDVVVVGAGLAGLACATTLHRAGLDVRVVEASDGVGGRVRTDHVDGFQLDRGFQVLLTAYPELHRQFDVEALDLREFAPGALVWRRGRGSAVVDPFRDPRHAVATALAPIGSPLDKLRIARLRHSVRSVHPALLLTGDDRTTADALADRGFSSTMIDRFFRPLVGGIQLDPELKASRRMFDMIFRMLADGAATVPAAGMQALPRQLAARLPVDAVELETPATAVRAGGIDVGGVRHLDTRAVVVAAEGPAAATLLDLPHVESRSVGCVYFAADEAPTDSKMVVLDGDHSGAVLNVAVMSNVAPEYAPPGRHLVVAALPGYVEPDLVATARHQLRGWWGDQVDRWEPLASYRIAHGQPSQEPPLRPKQRVSLGHGLFVCGDHRDTASIQGALFSGRRCADAVMAHLGMSDHRDHGRTDQEDDTP
jgi:phytoene dehydrogenase-like protein